MDDNFNWDFNQYGGQLGDMWGTAGPMNAALLNQQGSGPYAGWLMDNATAAGGRSGWAADKLQSASDSTMGTANNFNNWAGGVQGQMTAASPGITNFFNNLSDLGTRSNDWLRQVQNGIYHEAPTTQNYVDTMSSLGGQSNDLYGQAIGYQKGQQGNVQGSANNLYGAGNNILDTAFDPRGAVYADTAGKLVDQTRAAEYARGIQMSPYGASVEADTMKNFNLDWQNQQLARQTQGASAAAGAYGNAQGMNDNYTNNLSGLQTSMNSNYANLATSGTSLFDQWAQMQGNVAGSFGSNYSNLAGSGASILGNWGQAQGGAANSFGRALGDGYSTAGNLANQGVQMQLASGQYPYAAQQQIYGDRNAALGSYMGNYAPYLQGLGTLQGNALSYMGYGTGAQNQAWNQNNANRDYTNNAISQISGPLGQAFGKWMGGLGGNGKTSGPYYTGGAAGDSWTSGFDLMS